MEKDWGTVLIQNWGPMLILVVVWVYFMRRYGRGGGWTGVWQEHFTRHDRPDTEDGLGQLRPSGADQPRHAHDFPGAERKRDRRR